MSKLTKVKLRWETPASALERFNPQIVAKKSDDANTINIYSTIGEYGDGNGMTPKIVSAILRKADGEDITVNINSPGGDFFDGLAIHTLFAEYDGKVNMNILGMAASAASVVALAGDTINIAEAGFFMIHNAWSIAIGNRHDMQAVSDMLEQFDASMVTLYSKATGIDAKAIAKMMDNETWIVGSDAVDQGFASAILGDDKVQVEDKTQSAYSSALRKIDTALAKSGITRSERRELIKELTATPCAGKTDNTPGAVDDELGKALTGLLETFKQK